MNQEKINFWIDYCQRMINFFSKSKWSLSDIVVLYWQKRLEYWKSLKT